MRALPDGIIHLIYADPPFFTQRDFSNLYEQEKSEFSDVWESGMNGYLSWLKPRLVEMRRLLSYRGSIYLHLDWHASHYVKVLMDSIFGYRNFLNEIIWHYKDPAGTVRDRFKKKHDTILLYSKNAGKHTFNMDSVRMEYSKGTIRQGMGGVISFGRPTKLHSLGKVPEDVWEIPIINSQAKERLGYPTQKPLRLLQTIVKASSSEGDLVADFFCGSGTTPSVAQSLGRRWLAADNNRSAITTTMHRLGPVAGNRADGVSLLTCGVVTLPSTGVTRENHLGAWTAALGLDSDSGATTLTSGAAEFHFPGGTVSLRIRYSLRSAGTGASKSGNELVIEGTRNTRDGEESWILGCPVEELSNPFEERGHRSSCFSIRLPVSPSVRVEKHAGLPALRLELCPMGDGIPMAAALHWSNAGNSGRRRVTRLTANDIASCLYFMPFRGKGKADVRVTVHDSNGGSAQLSRRIDA